ncbi:MAG: aminoacyl--tRNA ligase-related protein, partial [Actinomycetota bacterium]|nr:aminoacyl--tRNA ligase-related protein [Actinomycetota bacterium]
ERHGLDYAVKEADAAFYGPKIDIDVKDAIGRSWQLSTIQCDFNLPEQFDLHYVAADGERHRPIMLHRALFGSIERFFGVMVEHYGGAFPTWLSPVQVQVLGVRADHDSFADKIVERLISNGIRAEMVEADEPLGTRIRKGKLEKLPYILVVGDADVEHDTAGVNPRGGDVERDVPIVDFVQRITAEIAEKATGPNVQ